MLNKIPTNLDDLSALDVKVLRNIKRVGERHLKHYYATMSIFKHPELRMKCFDTLAYERVLPKIERILREQNDQQEEGTTT